MLRPIDRQYLKQDLARIHRLNTEVGGPSLGEYFSRILADGWVDRNPEIYHLYETEGRLQGHVGLIPIAPASYRSYIAGERYPFFDIRPTDILTADEYRRARLEGAYLWIESYIAAGAAARRELGEHVYATLSRMHLKGLLATSSSPASEEHCRWLGLKKLRECGPSLTGVRKLWHADESVITASPDQPLGPATPVRCLFLMVHSRFGSAAPELVLSPTERRVARLFYLDTCKAEEIARLLKIQPGTVKTHLQRIRDKAEPVVGCRVARRLAAYLEQHPAVLAEPEA